MQMRFARVALQSPNDKVVDLTAFYAAELAAKTDNERDELRIGETQLVFEGVAGNPFYHFAFLVPGNRFDAALQWSQTHFDLLPDSENGELVFDFENWSARAFYFRDPADNIVELIAHPVLEKVANRARLIPPSCSVFRRSVSSATARRSRRALPRSNLASGTARFPLDVSRSSASGRRRSSSPSLDEGGSRQDDRPRRIRSISSSPGRKPQRSHSAITESAAARQSSTTRRLSAGRELGNDREPAEVSPG
jgi:hypothetical protein